MRCLESGPAAFPAEARQSARWMRPYGASANGQKRVIQLPVCLRKSRACTNSSSKISKLPYRGTGLTSSTFPTRSSPGVKRGVQSWHTLHLCRGTARLFLRLIPLTPVFDCPTNAFTSLEVPWGENLTRGSRILRRESSGPGWTEGDAACFYWT